MSSYAKLLVKILQGRSDANIGFTDLCFLLKKLKFDERIRGDHHIFTKFDIEEIINLQPISSKAKPYQVKQVRSLIIRYGLTQEEKDEQ
ncbi:MAG: type II toxin-antitoxin system HicA family toxin [Spirochaetota bacterium]